MHTGKYAEENIFLIIYSSGHLPSLCFCPCLCLSLSQIHMHTEFFARALSFASLLFQSPLLLHNGLL